MDAVQVSRAGAVRGPWPDAAKPALGRARDGSRHRTGAGTVIHDQTNQHLIPVVANALLLSVITAGVLLRQILDVARLFAGPPPATCLTPR